MALLLNHAERASAVTDEARIPAGRTSVTIHITIDREAWAKAGPGELSLAWTLWESPDGEAWESLGGGRITSPFECRAKDDTPLDHVWHRSTQGVDRADRKSTNRLSARTYKLGDQDYLQRALYPRFKVSVDTKKPCVYGVELVTVEVRPVVGATDLGLTEVKR